MSVRSALAMLSTAPRSLHHLRKAQMTKRIQVTPGDRYGRLTVVCESEPYKAPCGESYRRFTCRCDCGETSCVRLDSLRNGVTQSCGCLKNDHIVTVGHSNATHGMDGTPTHKAWLSMRQRCLNPRHPYYEYYGGRGIRICPQWLDSFRSFLDDMGVRPDGKTLDRIDNNGNYEPTNCRWATQSEQNRNMRRTRRLTFNNETLCLSEWARRTGISRCAITSRLLAGLSIEDTLTIPAGSIRNLRHYATTQKASQKS